MLRKRHWKKRFTMREVMVGPKFEAIDCSIERYVGRMNNSRSITI